MPEIAEVETVRNTLKKQILQRKIIKIKIKYPKMIESNALEFQNILEGKPFLAIKRVGNCFFFYYLLSHLRMEGKYFIKKSNDEILKHEHIIFSLDNGYDLRYHDTRKFGRMRLINKDELNTCEEITKQGYEPMDKALTPSYLLLKFKNKRLPLNPVLLFQTIISGLGNIYADEVLFKSKINPLRIASSINEDEARKIIDSAKNIILASIKCGGTTIRSYTSSLGVIGHYQDYLCVHKQEDKPCHECGTLIKKIKVNGRSTYFCSNCQK